MKPRLAAGRWVIVTAGSGPTLEIISIGRVSLYQRTFRRILIDDIAPAIGPRELDLDGGLTVRVVPEETAREVLAIFDRRREDERRVRELLS